jgi:phospholipid/cholesterol/gamma-HCH transport system substrate-binding protein
VSAEFPRTTGLYQGSSVRILGVPVGKVTHIQPKGDVVEVDFTYPARYKVPADASAVIVPPSIVGDRYLQLTPVYRGGPLLADGSTLPESRTQVPIEYDQIMSSLDQLDTALGPQGANQDGALSQLVDVGAANLDGNGQRMHDTLHAVADLVGTLDGDRTQLVAVIDHLDKFTTALANDDGGVRRVNADLAQVSTFLADERGDLTEALSNLAVALKEVGSFVHDNKGALTTDLKGLTDISGVLAKNRTALTEFLDDAPVALTNLAGTYNFATHTLDTRSNIDQLTNPGAELCQLLESVKQTCPDALKHLPSVPTSAPSPPSSLAGLLGVRS